LMYCKNAPFTVILKFIKRTDAKIFHTHVATALYLANRTRPLIGPAIGELCEGPHC
jgi:hypothetical protein